MLEKVWHCLLLFQGWLKSEALSVGLEDEESASDFNMEKAEALMAQPEVEKEPNEIDQNETNTELGELSLVEL